MQRAAASPSNTTPSSKRQRLANGRPNPRHSNPDLDAMRAAVAAEDAKRQRALEEHAAEQGETRWRLSVREVPRPAAGLLAVQPASFAELDAPASDEDEDGDGDLPRKAQTSLRMSYGKVRTGEAVRDWACANRGQPKERASTKRPGGADCEGGANDADSDSSGDDSGSEYDPLGVDDLIQKGRAAAQPSNGRQRSPDHIAPRSISGVKPGAPAIACFRCGGPHKKVDCPLRY
jgi:hypothetical protein